MPSAPRGKKAQRYRSRSERRERIEIIDFDDDSPDSLVRLLLENGPGTIFIASTLIIIHLIVIFLSGNIFITNIRVVEDFVQFNPLIMQGEIWRLFTSIFIHGGIFHLGGNLLFLFIFGWRLEELIGTKLMLLAFILTGLGGSLLTLSLVLIETNPFVSLGASGAVQGLFSASVTYMYYDKKYPKGGLVFLSAMVIFFIFTIGANTNFLSHLGGLITGVLFAYTLNRINK